MQHSLTIDMINLTREVNLLSLLPSVCIRCIALGQKRWRRPIGPRTRARNQYDTFLHIEFFALAILRSNIVIDLTKEVDKRTDVMSDC